jgi:hypothetical protein
MGSQRRRQNVTHPMADMPANANVPGSGTALGV